MKYSSPARIDLFGGTLDIEPINCVLQNVYTINMAISVQSTAEIEYRSDNLIKISSENYKMTKEFKLDELKESFFYQDGIWSTNYFGELTFIASLFSFFNIQKGFNLNLSSDVPAGSGLGGSSCMGMTVFKLLSVFFEQNYSLTQKIDCVKSMEARILNQGMPGYQDYFPPALGGLLAISKGSDYQVEQFYSRELADQMNHHLTLIYSGHSRNSGPNNWKIYKDFFDGDKKTISALIELAKNSDRARKSLLKKDYSGFLQNIFHEARIRREFFPDLYDEKTLDFYNDAKKIFGSDFEIKICGAGGGGCFAVLGDINRGKLEDLVSKYSMQILNGDMVAPVQEEKI